MNTILLIDNNAKFQGLKQTLDLAGFRVASASNDLEGLEAILHSSFDLIILPTRKSGIDTKILGEYLETFSSKTILVTISPKYEVEISQLPKGDLPVYFTRFFIETIQYLHSEQQNQQCKKVSFSRLRKPSRLQETG